MSASPKSLSLALFALTAMACAVPAQISPPQLLVDINRSSRNFQQSSFPSGTVSDPGPFWRERGFARLGGRVFFSATTAATGTELFVADENPGSGALLADVRPGTSGSEPGAFLTAANRVFFVATDGTQGYQIWATAPGGQAPVTRMTTLPATNTASAIGSMIEFGGRIYFTAPDGTGLVRVHALDPSTSNVTQFTAPFLQNWENPVVVDNRLILFEGAGFQGNEPFWVDTLNAVILRDGPGSGGCRFPVVLGGFAWFTHDDGGGWAIWRWSGTGQPQKVALLNADGWTNPVVSGSRILFAANPSGTASRPFSFDTANTGAGVRSIPTETSIGAQPACEQPVVFQGSAYYWGYSATQSPAGHYLFRSDGVTASSVAGSRLASISQLTPAPWTDPEVIGGTNSSIVFRYQGTRTWLYTFDGTGVSRLVINPGGRSENAIAMTRLGGSVLFGADDGRFGTELWSTDGTGAGTVLHTNLAAETRTDSSTPKDGVPFGRQLLFTADDGVGGREIWVTDGQPVTPFSPTGGGTKVAVETEPGPGSGRPRGIHGLDKAASILFNGDSLLDTLWISIFDPNTQTLDLFRAPPGADVEFREADLEETADLDPFYLAVGEDPQNGRQVRVIQKDPGVGVTTTPLVATPTPEFEEMNDPVQLDGFVYFLGKEGPAGDSNLQEVRHAHGGGLAAGEIVLPGGYTYISSLFAGKPGKRHGLHMEATRNNRRVGTTVDPATGATTDFKTTTGPFENAFSQPFPVDSGTLFVGQGAGGTDVLHETDGTAAGTRAVNNVALLGLETFDDPFRQAHDVVSQIAAAAGTFFFPVTVRNGVETWVASSTGVRRVGTQVFNQVWQAIPLGDRRIAAIAETNANGTELYIIDDTSVNMVSDSLAPGAASGVVRDGVLWAIDGRVVFTGSDPTGVGNELFYVDVGSMAQPYGASSNVGGSPDMRLVANDPLLGRPLGLSVLDAPPSARSAVFALSTPSGFRLVISELQIYLDVATPFLQVAAIANGIASFALPVPNDPVLLGLRYDGQAVVLPVPGFPLATTNAVSLTLGQ